MASLPEGAHGNVRAVYRIGVCPYRLFRDVVGAVPYNFWAFYRFTELEFVRGVCKRTVEVAKRHERNE